MKGKSFSGLAASHDPDAAPATVPVPAIPNGSAHIFQTVNTEWNPGAIPYRSTTAGISVDLARVNDAMEMPNADREDALFVAITRDGSIFFDGRVKDIAALPPKIRQHLDEGAERKVYLKVDARARYGPVRESVGYDSRPVSRMWRFLSTSASRNDRFRKLKSAA